MTETRLMELYVAMLRRPLTQAERDELFNYEESLQGDVEALRKQVVQLEHTRDGRGTS